MVVQSEGGAAGTGELGSGVIIDKQGDMLTALHVVRGASTIEVSFADGTTSPHRSPRRMPSHDIAVLTPSTLPAVVVPAVLGGAPQIGDEVFRGGQSARPRRVLVGRGGLGVEPDVYAGRTGRR